MQIKNPTKRQIDLVGQTNEKQPAQIYAILFNDIIIYSG